MDWKRKSGLVTNAIALLIAGGTAGYIFCHVMNKRLAAAGEEPPLPPDYFTPPSSFSEVQNAKDLLEGLSHQYITQFQEECWIKMRCSRPDATNRVFPIQTAVEELERGMKEFGGTPEEFRMARELMDLFKRNQQSSRWVDIYLAVLYAHPATGLVGEFANEAIVISRKIGREQELRDAFHHLTKIPLDLPTKKDIQAALIQSAPQQIVAGVVKR